MSPRCTQYSYTLPETNIAPESRASQKEISSSSHWFSGDMLVLGSAYTLSFAVLMMDPIRIGWLRRQASRIYYGSLVSTMLSCFGRHSCQLLNLSQWILTYVMALSLRICCKLFRVSQATRLRPGSDQTRRSSENLCNATMYSENCHAEVYS